MTIPSRAQRVRGAPAPNAPSVGVDWGLSYEALVGLALFIGGEQESTYDVGEGWFKSVRAKASPGLRQAARRLAGKEGFLLIGLAGLAREAGGRRVRDLVAAMRRDRSGATKRALMHGDPKTVEAALSGEAAAKRLYLDHLHFPPAIARRILEADPRALANATADLLERWDLEIFSELAPGLQGELEASAQAAARLARQLPGDRLIVKVTRGVEYRPEPWISSVVLVPSVLGRPWVDITESDGTKYFFYPAGSGAAAPDIELVEVYKALGDETRLRILRQLAAGVTSLSEIAEKLGLAKSTVHGHMVVLRTAGLTRSIVGAEGKGYVLNERPDLNSLLDAYMKG